MTLFLYFFLFSDMPGLLGSCGGSRGGWECSVFEAVARFSARSVAASAAASAVASLITSADMDSPGLPLIAGRGVFGAPDRPVL